MALLRLRLAEHAAHQTVLAVDMEHLASCRDHQRA